MTDYNMSDETKQETNRNEFHEENRAMWFGIGWIIKGILIIGGLGLLFTTINYAILPWWNDLQTKGTEHSYTYVQTKKELLYKLMMNYEQLGPDQEGQKKAIVNRMRIEASDMPESEIPSEVKQFLATHQ